MVLSLGTLCREIGSSPPELIGTVNGFVPLQLTSSSFAVLTCGVEPSGWYAMVNDTSYTVSITNTPMKSPITRTDNGETIWIQEPGDLYLITGKYVHSSKRFRKIYQDWNHVKYINMWAGTKWLLRAGRRYKITTVLGN